MSVLSRMEVILPPRPSWRRGTHCDILGSLVWHYNMWIPLTNVGTITSVNESGVHESGCVAQWDEDMRYDDSTRRNLVRPISSGRMVGVQS